MADKWPQMRVKCVNNIVNSSYYVLGSRNDTYPVPVLFPFSIASIKNLNFYRHS